MKVLQLSSEQTWRGGEQQIANLISELKQQPSLDTHILCRQDSPFQKHCQQQGWAHQTLPFKNSVDLKTAKGIKMYCQAHNIDLVHMHSARGHSVAVLAAVLGNKTPLLLSRRVDFVPKASRLTRWKYNHPRITRILCVSNCIAQIIKDYVAQPQKVYTVHSGIDLNRFTNPAPGTNIKQELGLPPQTILIGNTSALEGHKDYFTFLDTAKICLQQHPNLHFLIIGKGSLEAELKAYTATHNLQNHVTFTGFRKDIPQLLPQLQAFLMTSNQEGLGTSVLDAFACHVPVIATNAGGIPEMVQHQQTGWLAPVQNAQALAQGIDHLIQQPQQAKTWATNAHQKLLNQFTKQVMAHTTLNHYKQVLQA